jgi:hypothetical protein
MCNFLNLRRNLFYCALFLIASLLLVEFRTDAASSQPIVVRKGVMTMQTYNRLDDMDIRDEAHKTLSDVDVDWALGLLKSKPPRDTSGNRIQLHIWAVPHVTICKRLTASQKEKAYNACMELIASKSEWDKITAIVGLGSLHDARAVPTIRRIAAQRSGTAHVGTWARYILRKDFPTPGDKGPIVTPY